jgi:hypothetical protein
MGVKLNLEICNLYAKSNNGKCLDTNYKNSMTLMNWEWENGHKFKQTLNKIMCRKTWCCFCSGHYKKDKNYLDNLAKEKNGKCLSTKYINSQTKYIWECSKNHKWQAIAASIQTGSWCKICANKNKKNIFYWDSFVKKSYEGKCLSEEYKNNKTKLYFECKNNHKFYSKPNDVQQGYWCPYCSHSHSKPEIEMFEYIKSLYKDAQNGVKGLLSDKRFEIDVWIPNLKIGIEFDGTFWHSNKNKYFKPERDLLKNELCKKQGIKLIRIKEENWIKNKEKCIKTLLLDLGETNGIQ